MIDLAGQTSSPAWRDKEAPHLAGVSLAKTIQEGCDLDRECIFLRHIGHRALRMGKWKLVAVHHGKWELYDMESDRSELHNLAAKHPGKVKRMAKIWERTHKTFIEQAGEIRD